MRYPTTDIHRDKIFFEVWILIAIALDSSVVFPRAFDESHTPQMLDFHLCPLTCVSVRFGTHYG